MNSKILFWAEETFGHKNISHFDDNYIYLLNGDKKEISLYDEYLANEQKQAQKQARNEMLKNGSVSQDGKMWFNFESANMFMTAVGTLDAGETMPWYDKDRQKVVLTYDEAKAYSKEISIVMQSLYGLN